MYTKYYEGGRVYIYKVKKYFNIILFINNIYFLIDIILSLDGFDPSPPVRIRPARFHYTTMTRLIYAPKRKRLFSIAYIRHIHFDAPIFLIIIGLFRSTDLRVMSPTRFLCATMILIYIYTIYIIFIFI